MKILNPKKPGRYEGEYRGVRYSLQVEKNISIYQGYDDDGIRIIYALSAKEFKKKVDEKDLDESQREIYNKNMKHSSFRTFIKNPKGAR